VGGQVFGRAGCAEHRDDQTGAGAASQFHIVQVVSDRRDLAAPFGGQRAKDPCPVPAETL
jgi:hypothetical protein